MLLQKEKKKPDLLERLNSYHPKNIFTVKENPDYFLNTAFTYDDKFNCRVYKKPGKLPTHWKSEIPTKWKRNCVTGALHRAKRISSNFDDDIKILETTFLNVGYPKHFISHTVNSFLQDPPKDDNLIPSFLFEQPKKIFIKLPYCQRNEKLSKLLSPSWTISWVSNTFSSSSGKQDKSKVFSTLRTKTLTYHMTFIVVNKGDCSCGVDYIGETRNLNKCPDNVKEQAYLALVRPQLEYAYCA